MRKFISILLSLLLVVSTCVWAERIKDLTSVQGVRNNQLVGYGLVVGLDGTGDQSTSSPFTIQSFQSMLKQFGITVPSDTRFQLDNVAAVAVHAVLPPFTKPGQTIDITVNSISNAESLRGGSLLLTPLKGLDGRIYAIAQGNLIVGGFGAEGADGSRVTVNVPVSGRIPDGATVEREVPTGFTSSDQIVLNLNSPDFTTAKRVADSINSLVGPGTASAMDSTSIAVRAPLNPSQRVDYLSLLENIDVTPAEAAARVIINSRTGTIVVGEHVRISPVAITHGSLTVTVRENVTVDQPNPLTDADAIVVPDTDIEILEKTGPMFHFGPGPSLNDIVKAVNDVGVAPGDLMAILEALKQAGALRAEIMVI